MKNLLAGASLATAMTIGACAGLNAADLGNGISAGAEVDVNYTTGTEVWVYKVTPEVGWASPIGIDLSAESTLMLDDIEFTGVKWGADYAIGDTGLNAYADVATDADWERGDITMGMTWSF